MKRIAATLVTSALVGALAVPALAGSLTPSPVRRSQETRATVIPPSTVMPPSNGVGQTPSAPDTQAWRGEPRRADWDRGGGSYYYPKYYTPVYVPAQWVWDGHMWVLVPGYWAY